MSLPIIREAFQMGTVGRGRVPQVIGLAERQARTVLSTLLERGGLVAPGHHAPARLASPSEVAERGFPNLDPGLRSSA